MIIGGDVGGTKTNIALFDPVQHAPDRNAPRLIGQTTYPSGEHKGLEAIVDRFLADLGDARPNAIEVVCFGIAGPVLGGRSQTPNLPWVVDSTELAERFGFPNVTLINDLVATAEGISALKPDELCTLAEGKRPGAAASASGPAALIAPGTGLGMALLTPTGEGDYQVIASEGGHADLAPRTTDEIGLLRWLMERFPDHVSIERVVAGRGLFHAYRYLIDAGREGDPTVADAIAADESNAPRLVSDNALDQRCPVCVRALELFVSIYGAAAGNLALVAMATGGIYLGGGITPKILPKLRDGSFVEAFVAKGRFRGLLETMPVHVILNPETAMLGAARCAARQARNPS